MKLRVLMSAYQCGPGMGSVSQIGWEWYSRLARKTPVTLVTHTRNRAAIERAGGAIEGSEIVYVDTEWFARPLYRFAKWLFPKSEHSVFLVSSLDYFVYDRKAYRMLKKRRGEWDAVHAPTPVSPVAPTTLFRLGLPLFIGPLNGGLGVPEAFPEVMREDSGWLIRVRVLGRWLDRLMGSSRRAARVFAANAATRASVHPKAACTVMLENGVELSRFVPAPWPEAPSAANPLRIAYVGRLVPFKGLPMLFEAIQRVRAEFPVEAEIVGDGPKRADWEAEVRARGIADIVKFAGNRTLDEAAEAMRRAHVFCLPSVRESGGAVLLEAMASNRPVIAVAYGGPAEVVDGAVGAAIAPAGRASVVEALASALRDVVKNPEEWKKKGAEGRLRAESEYGWDAKVERALEIFRETLGGDGSESRPNGPKATGQTEK